MSLSCGGQAVVCPKIWRVQTREFLSLPPKKVMEEKNHRGMALVAQASRHYAAMARFRLDRQRNKRYNYGDQWSDRIDVDGRAVTEEEYIKSQGNIPLKNNLIRRLVRNVIGVYNSRAGHPMCAARHPADSRGAAAMTALLRSNMEVNRMSALLTRSIEEFLISGMVVHRKSYGTRDGRTDCWTDYVVPDNVFIDTGMSDFRGWDCRIIGEIHELTTERLTAMFALGADDCETFAERYGPGGKVRVYEIWRRETRCEYVVHDISRGCASVLEATREVSSLVEQDNRRRVEAGLAPLECVWRKRDVWRYYFVDESGNILREGDTPYRHGSHPFVFKAYPMIDGEIHSFVGDVIDQQRYTNRLITLYDWIMRASSKGVLLVPEDCVPRGCDPSEFADAWSRYNGVIFYKPSASGNMPSQISNNSTNIGIRELLDVQLKFFEDISGVNQSLQGKTSNVGMSAELFSRQTHNATTTLLDILDTFDEFVRDGAYKDVSNILQYYSPSEVRAAGGADLPADMNGWEIVLRQKDAEC